MKYTTLFLLLIGLAGCSTTVGPEPSVTEKQLDGEETVTDICTPVQIGLDKQGDPLYVCAEDYPSGQYPIAN